MLDLRIPSGLFFALLGVILVAYSFIAPDNHAPMTEGNINLCSGIFMVLFGAAMLALAWRGRAHS